MHLTKHHGLGNDFLVALVDEVPANGADLARSLCQRRRGVGADGLIFGTPAADADLAMTFFNADGSGAEISGNGIRCLAQALSINR
ncbi:MAG: diaminopimelate epimerase, partial [Acidimicrobiales bacterium]